MGFFVLTSLPDTLLLRYSSDIHLTETQQLRDNQNEKSHSTTYAKGHYGYGRTVTGSSFFSFFFIRSTPYVSMSVIGNQRQSFGNPSHTLQIQPGSLKNSQIGQFQPSNVTGQTQGFGGKNFHIPRQVQVPPGCFFLWY